MRKYFQENVNDCTVYHLCAVLVHRGQSAHSGHYIAHIKDRATGKWYKFNDEFVEKTEGNVIRLCYDGSKEGQDPIASTADEKPSSSGTTNGPSNEKQSTKFTKGSSDPYMLVYKIANLDDKSKPII